MLIIKCLKCHNDIKNYGKKFCSKSCSASYNNAKRRVSQSQKEKTSATLKLKYKSGKIKSRKIHRFCELCGNLIEKSGAKYKFCSRECLSNSPRMKLEKSKAGRKSAMSRVKRSKDEILLYNLILQKFPDALPNYIISDGWDCDIFIPTLSVAIMWNGAWHYKQLNISNHSLKQVQNRDRYKLKLFKSLGYTTYVYEDRYYTPLTAYEDLMVRAEGIEPSREH